MSRRGHYKRSVKRLQPLELIPGVYINDFCLRIGISRPTAYAWIAKGIIHPVRVDKRWMIPSEQVTGLLRSNG
jgi:Helix-turn-helix domain